MCICLQFCTHTHSGYICMKQGHITDIYECMQIHTRIQTIYRRMLLQGPIVKHPVPVQVKATFTHTHTHIYRAHTWNTYTVHVPVIVTLWSTHIRSQACHMMMNQSWFDLERLKTLWFRHLLALVLLDTHTYIEYTVYLPVIVMFWSMHICSQACHLMMNQSPFDLKRLQTLWFMHLSALVLLDTHTYMAHT
jgi:hypothetical protein